MWLINTDYWVSTRIWHSVHMHVECGAVQCEISTWELVRVFSVSLLSITPSLLTTLISTENRFAVICLLACLYCYMLCKINVMHLLFAFQFVSLLEFAFTLSLRYEKCLACKRIHPRGVAFVKILWWIVLAFCYFVVTVIHVGNAFQFVWFLVLYITVPDIQLLVFNFANTLWW